MGKVVVALFDSMIPASLSPSVSYSPIAESCHASCTKNAAGCGRKEGAEMEEVILGERRNAKTVLSD